MRIEPKLLAPAVVAALALVVSARPSAAVIPVPIGAYRHVRAEGREIEKTEIAKGVWQFTVLRDAYVRVLNSVAIVCDDGVIVFDTCTRPSSARLILAEIRKLTNRPVRLVIDSHWHPDHWSGNEVYADSFPGVEILATRETRAAMENTQALWARRFATQLRAQRDALAKEIATGKLDDGTLLTPERRRDDEEDAEDYATLTDEAAHEHLTLPTSTYVDHLDLRRSGREIRLMSRVGDSPGTTVLWMPKERVLLTGDALSYPIPYVSMPAAQARTLRELAALHPRVIVPGHGPAFHDVEYLELEATLFETIVHGVEAALRNGAETLEDVQKQVTADELRPRFTAGDPELDRRYRERVAAIVKLAVREARAGADL